MLEIIKSPWECTFLRLLKEAKTNVYLASPFIKMQTASIITKNTNACIDFRYINSFKLAHFHNGSSDLEALKILRRADCKQKSVHNLHAKLFIFDTNAIITSGNLTPGGLKNNLEYGILIQDEIVDEIKNDYLAIFNKPDYPEITISIIEKAEEILRSIPKEKRKTIKINEKSLFEDVINDENIEERFDGGTESIISNLSQWEKDVFGYLLKINNDIFSLHEVYRFTDNLSQLHPKNKNVKAKIRQQLQYLRDIGLIEFLKPGIYKKLWA